LLLFKGILDKAKEDITINKASTVKDVNNAFCLCSKIIDKQSGSICEPKSEYAKR